LSLHQIASTVWGGQADSNPVTPHFVLLMGLDTQITLRLGSAQQYKTFGAINWIVGSRIALVDAAHEQPARTCETPALMTDRRQADTCARASIPDVLVFVTLNGTRPFGRFEYNLKALRRHHSSGCVPPLTHAPDDMRLADNFKRSVQWGRWSY